MVSMLIAIGMSFSKLLFNEVQINKGKFLTESKIALSDYWLQLATQKRLTNN